MRVRLSGRRVRPGLAGALMIGALAGCDNVAWGGADFEWRPPPPKEVVEPEISEEPEEVLPPLPEGPVLFLVQRADAEWRAEPLGEIGADTLMPMATDALYPGFTARYVRERLGEGREFVLFQGSSRLGRFVAGAQVQPDSTYCQPRPSVSGFVELVPEAVGLTSFLALPAEQAGHLGRGLPVDLEMTRGQGITSYRLAEQLFNERRYRWPPDIAAARASVRVFPTAHSAQPLIASTYLYRDGLGVGAAPEAAYSMFFIAEDRGSEYAPTYVWYRNVEESGKGAPRLQTWGDWDADGQEELLLDVFGAESRWLAALDRPGGATQWHLSFQDACGQPRRPAA